MIFVLTRKITNRVSYIFRLLLEEMLGLDITLSTNQAEFDAYEGPKLAYGVQPSSGGLYFAADDLLFETGISVKSISYIEFEGNKAFFSTYQRASALPFDVFAAAFFLVSRYEEYLPHIRDEHGRFLASGSEAYKNGFLQKPLVNIWTIMLGKLLTREFPELKVTQGSFIFLPSIDIDAAYAFKHKGITRALGGMLNAIIKNDPDELSERIKVLAGTRKDPFDTFDEILRLQLNYGLNFLIFILLADYGPRDKNLPVNNRQFMRLIRKLSDYAEIGIHPSYASSGNPERLGMEINRLAKILHTDITRSRQHFLRLEFPVTYRNLLNYDILEDYSMGYAEEPGFRASICTAFHFYDLDLDMPTHLRIHPFAVMDGTLNDYLRLTPAQATDVIASLIKEVKAVGGTFIPLWHNQTLNNRNEWYGWFPVFENMIRTALDVR
jgi:hypothetical protein